MRTSRIKKPANRPGRPRVLGPTIPDVTTAPGVSPSLPPATPGAALVPPIERFPCPKCGTLNSIDRKKCTICKAKRSLAARPKWYCPPDSRIRRVALMIIAMRMGGYEDEEIASALKISPRSIRPYVYRAGKNGWLNLDNPREKLEYQLAHKAVDNLAEMLDSNEVMEKGQHRVKHDATIEMLKGTIFKTFDEAPVQQQSQTVVAVKIEMPAGPTQVVREDTMGGTPAHILEAEHV